jgi:hypothetical protein
MECSDGLIRGLLDCYAPFCTYAYRLHHIGGKWAQSVGPKPPAVGEWIAKGEEWCDYTGIGFCKVTAKARVRPLAESNWETVDIAIAKATDVRVHVHWPEVEHYHR